MYIGKVTNDYDIITVYDNITFTNCTNNEHNDNIIIFNYLLLSKPRSIILFSVISLMLYTLIKPLFNNK